MEMLFYIPILFVAGAAAGLVDSVAGGGGLISVPVLLMLGMSPVQALGTNKFQACFGSFTAARNYIRHGQVNPRHMIDGIAFTFIGAAAGTLAVQQLSDELLGYIIPVLLGGILIYSAINPKLGDKACRPRMNRRAFYLLLGLGLGFYDGFFGPGTGSFWMIGFMLFRGLEMRATAGHTKVVNFTSNITSLIFFAIGGKIVLWAGLPMAAGEILGARVGSTLAVKRGAKFIRPVFLLVMAMTIAWMVWQML